MREHLSPTRSHAPWTCTALDQKYTQKVCVNEAGGIWFEWTNIHPQIKAFFVQYPCPTCPVFPSSVRGPVAATHTPPKCFNEYIHQDTPATRGVYIGLFFPAQDAGSSPPGFWTIFRIGNPNLNRHLCQGLNSDYFHIIGDKLINPIVGVYIAIIRIPIKGGMTIPKYNEFRPWHICDWHPGRGDNPWSHLNPMDILQLANAHPAVVRSPGKAGCKFVCIYGWSKHVGNKSWYI